MPNLRSEIDHLYVTLDANMKGRGRKGVLSNLNSLAGNAELDSPGLYFLFEPGEQRETGAPRVVRVGQATKTNLRTRLSQHTTFASPFFTLVWSALAFRHGQTAFYPYLRAPRGQIPNHLQQAMDAFVQTVVSPYVAPVEFTWIPIGHERLLKKVELWATVLLSNYWQDGLPIDPPSVGWLAKSLPTVPDPALPNAVKASIPTFNKVIKSGLWSSEFVDLDLTDGCCWDFEQLVRSAP